jgi:hypothetical protein
VNETAARGEVIAQALVHQPEGVGLVIGISRQPDIGHAAAVDHFL